MVLEFVSRHIPCVTAFVSDPLNVLISLGSLGIAAALFFALRKGLARQRLALVYGHLFFVFFPLSFFLVSMTCSVMSLPCHEQGLFNLVGYAIPLTLGFALLGGMFLLPLFYRSMLAAVKMEGGKEKDFLCKAAKKLGLKSPDLLVIDEAKPLAFSFSGFSSAVAVSTGLAQLLSRKEFEAVLLHELAHLKAKASFLKSYALFLRLFSPFSFFGGLDECLGLDEDGADEFVVKAQGTRRHLHSAKNKLRHYRALAR